MQNDSASNLKPSLSSASSLDESPCYERRILFALRKIMQQMDTHSHRLLKHYNITVTQAVCLYEVYEKGAQSISVLSKNVHLSNSTLVGVIDRLEEKGLVKRTRNVDDRRTIFINVTEKGKEFVIRAPYLLHNRLDGKLKILPENEQVIIANSLDLLVEILKEQKS